MCIGSQQNHRLASVHWQAEGKYLQIDIYWNLQEVNILHLRSINDQKCTLTSSKRTGHLASSQIVQRYFNQLPISKMGDQIYRMAARKVLLNKVSYVWESYEQSDYIPHMRNRHGLVYQLNSGSKARYSWRNASELPKTIIRRRGSVSNT